MIFVRNQMYVQLGPTLFSDTYIQNHAIELNSKCKFRVVCAGGKFPLSQALASQMQPSSQEVPKKHPGELTDGSNINVWGFALGSFVYV